MNSIVLDASAILAFLDDEPGADIVMQAMSSAVIGTVNLAEAYSKLAERGRDGQEALAIVQNAVSQIVPFSAEMAEAVGALRPMTKHLGLSLGDRACIALGMALEAEIYTMDRDWAKLELPCAIRVIR